MLGDFKREERNYMEKVEEAIFKASKGIMPNPNAIEDTKKARKMYKGLPNELVFVRGELYENLAQQQTAKSKE